MDRTIKSNESVVLNERILVVNGPELAPDHEQVIQTFYSPLLLIMCSCRISRISCIMLIPFLLSFHTHSLTQSEEKVRQSVSNMLFPRRESPDRVTLLQQHLLALTACEGRIFAGASGMRQQEELVIRLLLSLSGCCCFSQSLCFVQTESGFWSGV